VCLLQWHFHGAKVQHVVQADGMVYGFVCPIRRHDLAVLQASSMLCMLSLLYVNDDLNHPVKAVTDKAYRRTQHICPLHTKAELNMMNAWEWTAALVEDR